MQVTISGSNTTERKHPFATLTVDRTADASPHGEDSHKTVRNRKTVVTMLPASIHPLGRVVPARG